MADPLSVTLAVVTLATAAKDLVEVGKKIHNSFSAVPDNLRNARRVAADITDMLAEISSFCEAHQDVLEQMEDFNVALKGLLGRFRTFEASILPLLPKIGGGKRQRLMQGWTTWRDSNKIEKSISDLEGDVMRVMRRHMMTRAMSTEIKLEIVRKQTSRGLEVLDSVQKNLEALHITTPPVATTRGDGASSSTTDNFHRNIIMFANSTASTSAPMLRTPETVTEDLLLTATIKFYVTRITDSLDKMAKALPTSPSVSTSLRSANGHIDQFYMTLLVTHTSMSITPLRRHAVRHATHICDVLETDFTKEISMLDGADALYDLSIQLEALGMLSESISIGEWAITLARTIAHAPSSTHTSSGANPLVSAYLALYLTHISFQYRDSGNASQSLQAVEEALTLTHNLRNSQYGGLSQLSILHCDALMQHALLVDHQKAIHISLEVVCILEDIFGVHAFSQCEGRLKDVVQSRPFFLTAVFSSAPTTYSLTVYACALQRLGCYLLSSDNNGRECALDIALLGIEVRRELVSVHGPEYKAELAKALSALLQEEPSSHIPRHDVVALAEECILLFRDLVGLNPVCHARELIFALCAKARALESLDRDVEAIKIWEEAADLAVQIVQDSQLCATTLGHLSDQFRRLKRHDDAVRTRRRAIATYHDEAEAQGGRYFHLSQDLQALRRYKESAEAARTSVTLYRPLAMRDPGTWTTHLTEALFQVINNVAASGDYSDALHTWREYAIMLDTFLTQPPDKVSEIVGAHLAVLYNCTRTVYVFEDEVTCVDVCSTAIAYLRRLIAIFPEKAEIRTALGWCECQNVYNMLRIGRLQEARQSIACWLDTSLCEEGSNSVPTSESATVCAIMMFLKAEVMDAQGDARQALLVTRGIHDVVSPFTASVQYCFHTMVGSMVQESRLQIRLGNNVRALEIAEEALRRSRDNKPYEEATLDNNVVWALHSVALAAMSGHDYDRALEAAREGCDECETSAWQANEDEFNIFIRPSLHSILAIAEAHRGTLPEALSFAHTAINLALDIGMRKHDISSTTAERSYIETRGYLAELLLATGDISQLERICDERRVYFLGRVKKRMGEYRDLAPILRVLGVLWCRAGKHKEGEAAASELSEIMNRLRLAFPSLHEQLKIRLQYQASVPILKDLDEMTEKLECDHQKGISALFKD